MKNLSPIFIVSSGRSGTAMLEKLFKQVESFDAHHEFMCSEVQKIGCLKEMGIMSKAEAITRLKDVYFPAVDNSNKLTFLDSSNKVSWVIEELGTIFPNAKFIHVVRDGRKVVSSYFNKLQDEIYDDESVRLLLNYYLNDTFYPPGNKALYWPMPVGSKEETISFTKIDQFSRICWFWNRINMRIEEQFDNVSLENRLLLRLEDITNDENILNSLFDFLNVKYQTKYYEMMQTPHNVNVPKDFPLTDEQNSTFMKYCESTLLKYNYKMDFTYNVKYNTTNL